MFPRLPHHLSPGFFVMLVLAATGALGRPLAAELIVVDLNQSTSMGQPSVVFDLDGDGEDDFEIGIDPDEGFGFVEGIPQLELSPEVYRENGEIRIFQVGEVVSPSLNALGWEDFSQLYSGSSGPFGQTGTTGYIGVRLDDLGSPSDLYGWVEITRGSLTVGQFGFESTPNMGAMVGPAAIPEPSGVAMLIAGSFGWAVYRRRRRST